MELSARKASVRSRFFSLNHVSLRNSTADRTSPRRCRASRMKSRLSLVGKNHFGNCSSTEPS